MKKIGLFIIILSLVFTNSCRYSTAKRSYIPKFKKGKRLLFAHFSFNGFFFPDSVMVWRYGQTDLIKGSKYSRDLNCYTLTVDDREGDRWFPYMIFFEVNKYRIKYKLPYKEYEAAHLMQRGMVVNAGNYLFLPKTEKEPDKYQKVEVYTNDQTWTLFKKKLKQKDALAWLKEH